MSDLSQVEKQIRRLAFKEHNADQEDTVVFLHRGGDGSIDAWLAETEKNKSKERTANIMTDLQAFDMATVQSVAYSGVRICVIAGGKMDRVQAIKDMVIVLDDGGNEHGVKNETFVVRDAYHPWHL